MKGKLWRPALARLGPEGRSGLYNLAMQAQGELAVMAARGYYRASAIPSVRPAALEWLSRIASHPTVDAQVRTQAALALQRAGWTLGKESLAPLIGHDLSELVEELGYPASPPFVPDPWEEFLPVRIMTVCRDAGEERHRQEHRRNARLDEWSALLHEDSDSPRPDAGRNEPCPCGSGKKFKKCCLGQTRVPSHLAAWRRLATLQFVGYSRPPFLHQEQVRLYEIAVERRSRALEPSLEDSHVVRWATCLRLHGLGEKDRAAAALLQVVSTPLVTSPPSISRKSWPSRPPWSSMNP